jgi:hypothetical protein
MDTNPAQPEPRGNLSGLALYGWDNLLLAYRKAAKGKRGHADVAEFEYRLEANLLRLQRELQEQTYQPGAYHSFYIHDPKKRLISAAPYCLVSVDGLKNHPRINHECTKTEGHSFTCTEWRSRIEVFVAEFVDGISTARANPLNPVSR